LIYLDTSAIVPLFLPEARSRDAEALCVRDAILVSDLAAAEFSSALGLALRSGRIANDAALEVFVLFDAWAPAHAVMVETLGEDFTLATTFIRRFDLSLRTPDALHIAIASRLGATLATFDAQLADAARGLGLAVVP
jgi:uncharacterized protein